MLTTPRGYFATALLAALYIWFWKVSVHRIDDAPMSVFAHVFVTDCGDFEHFYLAARALREGSDLYGSGARGYIYPPLLAFLFIPLTFLTVKGAAMAMLAVNLSAGFACAWFGAAEVLRRMQNDKVPGDVLWVSSMSSLFMATRLRGEFQMWQTDVLMMLLMLLALRWLDARPRLAGLSLGLAVGIKYFPLLFLPYLLLRRRNTAASWMLVGVLVSAALPALASGWYVNLQHLKVALSGLLRLLGAAPLGPRFANIAPIDADYSISITSAIARTLGSAAAPGHALALSAAVAVLVLGFVGRSYLKAGLPLLRWPDVAAQMRQPLCGLIAIEWMAMVAFSLAFSPQTNPRHTSLLFMVATPLTVMLLLPKPGVSRWPASMGLSIMLFGLIFPPGIAGLEGISKWWIAVGGTGWCIAAMLPLLFFAAISYLRLLSKFPSTRESLT